MDFIILFGAILFGIGLVISILNTHVSYGFFTRYRSKNRSWQIISIILIIIGLLIIIGKAYLNGQLS